MHARHPLIPLAALAVVLVSVTLACDAANMRARDLPVWQCPTSTPVPTDVMPAVLTTGPGTPTLAPRPTYTPYPTPTPYELFTDFPLARNVRVGQVQGIGLGIWYTLDHVEVEGPFAYRDTETGTESERWVASWEITVRNASLTRDYEFYPFAQVYVLEVVDEQDEHLSGGWGISAAAHEQAGLPALDVSSEAALLPPGTTRTLHVAAFIPASRVWRLGIVLDPLDTQDTGEMLSRHSLGSNVAVWVNQTDTQCPSDDPAVPPGTNATPEPGQPVEGYLLTRNPLDSYRITRGFGCSEYYTGVRGTGCPASAPWHHNGVDYAWATGASIIDPLPVAGTVLYAGEDIWSADCSDTVGSLAPHRGYGNFVKQAATVDGYGLVLWYGHQSALGVETGDPTTPGQVLGQVGSTGCSTGPHLHFTVKVNGLSVDPCGLIPGGC